MSTPPASSYYNRNPQGNNQHVPCEGESEELRNILDNYNRRGVHNAQRLKELLLADHDIQMSVRTIERRKKAFGIYAAGKTKKILDEQDPELARQMVLDQMEKDKSRNLGVRATYEAIAYDTGKPLPREFIRQEMLAQDPEGFQKRMPNAKKTIRVPLTAIGPNDEWSADGHDKLSQIGLPIWGIRDKWSSFWVGLWAVPNNRIKEVVAYLYLTAVCEQGGVPIQSTTDAGSETTLIYGLANGLREIFVPDLDKDEVPAHRFMKSIHNIVVERGWHGLKLKYGDNIVAHWNEGNDIYNPIDMKQFLLARWIWSTAVSDGLTKERDKMNHHKIRKDHNKALPSGDSPAAFYKLPHLHGGRNCLQPVDVEVVKQMMLDLGGEDLVRFVTVGYETKARAIHSELNLPELTIQNAWETFAMMLPYMPIPEDDEVDFAVHGPCRN